MSDKTAKAKPAEKKSHPAKAAKPKAAEAKHKAKPVHKPAEAKEYAHAKAKADVPEAAKSEASPVNAEDVKVSVSEAQVSTAVEKPEDSEEKKSAGGFRAQKKAPEKKGDEKKEKKVLEERVYTIPLSSVMSSTRKRRANKAVRFVKLYVSRHMHSDKVQISGALNERIWSRGIQKPPRSIRVKVLKYEDSVVAELLG